MNKQSATTAITINVPTADMEKIKTLARNVGLTDEHAVKAVQDALGQLETDDEAFWLECLTFPNKEAAELAVERYGSKWRGTPSKDLRVRGRGHVTIPNPHFRGQPVAAGEVRHG